LSEKEKSFADKATEYVIWILESIDFYKNIFYLYAISHDPVLVIIYAFSITIPFVLFHRDVNQLTGGCGGYALYTSYGVVHSLLIFLGLTINKREEQARKHAIWKIMIYQNTIFFTFGFLEIFMLRSTVTWYQAVFPIYTLCMIY